jgi:cell division protein FtsI (penicillin-binding protein 3)
VPIAAELITRIAPLLGLRPEIETETPVAISLTSN